MSIYNAYAYGKGDVIIEPHPIYERMSADEAQMRKRYTGDRGIKEPQLIMLSKCYPNIQNQKTEGGKNDADY